MDTQLKKEIYHISGMHCRSCELLIEGNLLEVTGIKKVSVNHKKGTAEVYYDRKPPYQDLEKAIRNSGYSLGVGKKRPLIATNPMTYIELLFAGGVLVLVLIWLKVWGVFDINWQFSATPSLIVVLLIGLAAGISTCMALVGGLVLGISSRHAELHPEATSLQKFRPHVFFNTGRLISYGLLGGLIGLLGSTFKLSSSTLGYIVVLAGVLMLFLALKMTEVFPRLQNSGLLMPKSIARWIGLNRETKEYSHKSAFLTGAATFFLPCGFTQAMQVYAVSTGSFTKGAVIMSLFALGTAPGLLGIGGLTAIVKGAFGRYFFKFVALALIMLSLLNISNGFNLTGLTLASFVNNLDGQQLSGNIENGQQIVNMTQLSYGYQPNRLTVKNGIPVKLVVNATNIYSCSSIIVIPKFQIFKRLNEGLNEITFMPTATGPIKFSCAMGMYTGIINVIN